jgi:hypothetical protein
MIFHALENKRISKQNITEMIGMKIMAIDSDCSESALAAFPF